MAYIGREPQVGNFQVCDAISVVNGQAAYTMQVSSVNVSPETANHVLCSVNGILQQSGSSFTVSGSTITFASNLVTGDVIDFVHILGSVLDLGVPSDGTVTAAKVADDLISGKTALGAEPADTDEFLVSDAGVLKRMDYSYIKASGGLAVADQWRLTSNFSGSGTITSNLERIDGTLQGNLGSGMAESSGIFTFPSTGFYLVSATFEIDATTNSAYHAGEIEATANNSSYADVALARGGISGGNNTDDRGSFSCSSILDITDLSNHKVRFVMENASGVAVGSSSVNRTFFTFLKLGDT